jgi:hypothetical protein
LLGSLNDDRGQVKGGQVTGLLGRSQPILNHSDNLVSQHVAPPVL